MYVSDRLLSAHPLRPVLVLCSISACLLTVSAQDDDGKKKRQQVITNGRETTVLTMPEDSEGYIDYVKALNDQFSKGVTADNNFEVVVRQVLSPDEISEDMRAEYFANIGIPLPKEGMTFYQDYTTWVLGDDPDPAARDRAFDEHGTLMSAPWKYDDHPMATLWLERFGPDIDRLAEGSKRSRFYAPYLSGASDESEPIPRVISILLPSVQQQREIARALAIRAYGRIAEGDLESAWKDCQAMHRVAAHVASGSTLIENLVGIAIRSIAFGVESHILKSPDLTHEHAMLFLADLKVRKPLSPMWKKIDVAERYMGLDTVVTLARHGSKHGLFRVLKTISDLSDISGGASAATLVGLPDEPAGLRKIDAKPIDWNTTLRYLNEWYDRLVEAAAEEDFKKRRELFAAIDQDLEKLKSDTTSVQALLKGVVLNGTQKALGKSIGNVLVALLLPAVEMARKAEDESLAKAEVLKAGFALRARELSGEEQAKSLNDLVPKYLPEVPGDACSTGKLKYVLREGGFWVYSVGRNGRDDQGRTLDDEGNPGGAELRWDDIVIRTGGTAQ